LDENNPIAEIAKHEKHFWKDDPEKVK